MLLGCGLEGWSPAQLTSLAAWYEAGPTYCWQDAGCTVACGDGDPIYTWQDRSGNGYHLTQSDVLKRPTLRLVNGKWCVRFDGVNDGLTCNSLASIFAGAQNSYETVLVVNNCTDSTGVVWAAASSIDGTPIVFHRPRTSDVIASYRRGDGSTPDYILGGSTGSGKYLLGWAFSGTNLISYINGNLDLSTGITTTGGMSVDMFNVGRLDRFGGPSEHVSADIGTILFTSSVMSNSERVASNNWLNSKYAIY